LTGKFAMGWVHQEVGISGGSRIAEPGLPPRDLPNRSLVLVQPTNAGNYERDHFAVMPEFLARLGYQITPHVRAMVGYDVLALTSVVRPGMAIDPGVNPSLTDFLTVRQATDARRPAFNFSGTDFWAQGLTLGLMVTY